MSQVEITARRPDSGLSVIEMVVVISLMGFLMSVASLAFRPALDSWVLSAPRTQVTDTTTYAVQRMINEISQVRNPQSVTTATAARFQFTDVGNTAIDYYLNGTNLMRNNDILARGVTSLAFSYWDVNDAALANPAVAPASTNIWRISVRLAVLNQGQSVSVESQIRPRNFPRT